MTHVSKCFYLLTSFNLTSSQPSNKKSSAEEKASFVREQIFYSSRSIQLIL